MEWYFNGPHGRKEKKLRGKQSRSGLKRTIWHYIRFHMGTTALGSLIIATVQMMRLVL